jgi:hypothetical protein
MIWVSWMFESWAISVIDLMRHIMESRSHIVEFDLVNIRFACYLTKNFVMQESYTDTD